MASNALARSHSARFRTRAIHIAYIDSLALYRDTARQVLEQSLPYAEIEPFDSVSAFLNQHKSVATVVVYNLHQAAWCKSDFEILRRQLPSVPIIVVSNINGMASKMVDGAMGWKGIQFLAIMTTSVDKLVQMILHLWDDLASQTRISDDPMDAPHS